MVEDEITAGSEPKGASRPTCGLSPEPDSFFDAAALGPTGTSERHNFSRTKGETFGSMVKPLLSMFSLLENDCKINRSKVKSSGSIFPLPDRPRALREVLGPLPNEQLLVLSGVCKALNSYYGSPVADRPVVTAAARLALDGLAASVRDSQLVGEKFEGLKWQDFMGVRTVDYRGEEVRVAKSFAWANIEPALPDGIGSIPLSEVCERGTLDFVMHFEKYLLPEESRVYTKPPKVFVCDGDWERVCSGLISKGACRLIAESEVYHLNGKPVLNGLFGVSKDEFVHGVEVHRLIMNLVPVNKLCRNLGADVCTLPSVVSLGGVVLGPEEFLVMSSEDIKCFFYIFSVPSCWHRFLAFGRRVSPSLVAGGSNEPYYLSSLVLPMGFISSVAIAQHVHRRIARMSLHSLTPTFDPKMK